jgi:hypothetical protein
MSYREKVDFLAALEMVGEAEVCERLEAGGYRGKRWRDRLPVIRRWLARQPWRRAVKVVNEVLNGLRLEKAREKTFIGRVEQGFDFLGYRLYLTASRWPRPPGRGLSNVCSGFKSQTGGSRTAPPGWMCTSGVGAGG